MKKKNPLGKIALLAVNFALLFALFRLLISLSGKEGNLWLYYVTTIVYGAATAAVFIAFYIKNGFSFDREFRTADQLPAAWSEERKHAFMENQPKNKKSARRLLYVLLPLTLTLLVSFIMLNFIK